MKNIRWVIQNNLIAENDLNEIQEICKSLDVEFQEVMVIPMTKELPEIIHDDKVNLYYGSTTFMDNLYEQLDRPFGLFYNHETFSMENYINKWGEKMLNSEAMILPLKEIMSRDYHPFSNDWVFIRPDGDGKEFDGQVMKFEEVKKYLGRHLLYEGKMTFESKIVLGPAYNIHKEWRNYVVDGEIVSSSLYRENFRLKKSGTDIPESMLEFVRARISEYKPHDNFAIDIASTHDGTYYIIECGCLNSVGFYKSSISDIITKITEYAEKHG
jgi:hypothetical protein